MRVKQIVQTPSISNDGRSFRLVDNYPNQLNKTDLHYQPYAYINNGKKDGVENNDSATSVYSIMRLSLLTTTFRMMKRVLLRIWDLTKSTLYFVFAVLKFMWSALEFIALFIKFFFTQKHWTN
ncbi:hypothetical protein [Mucilaginibacter agri]|uniref:Uncharacterized protein n=1 Tax=Mucilaginibacter agri TaxID=2695265 RepID=A0A965ZCY3_9SPHI|nr:hypothetical protein [Mucilaginibacter agri]NCD68733.1 hypothetical protein [Mucilaginibacter agri]